MTIVTALSFSGYAHGYWFFRALGTLGSASNKALDITNKAVVTANAYDTMRHRRVNSGLTTQQLQFKNGLISSGKNQELNYSDRDYADQLRIEAWKLAEKKAHHGAKRKYEEALSIDANNSNTWHGYGYTLAELRKFDESQNAFETAIFLNNYSRNAKDESETWRYLGWNYHQQGYLKDADNFYVESLAINPENNKTKKALREIRKYSIPNSATSKTYRITARSGLRLRSGPSSKDRVILTLPYDGELSVLKYIGETTRVGNETSQWAQVSYQDRIGYVFGSHIQKISNNQDYTSATAVQHRPSDIQTKPITKTANSAHFHGQRSHKHLMPRTGVKHRHGNGPYGTYTAGKNTAQNSPTDTRPVFTVQAGVFSSYEGAKRHMINLNHSGYKPVINKRQKSGKQFFYVEFTGFKNMNEAQTAKTKIARANPKESFFTK